MVSIIVPVYNAIHYLNRSINSVVCQSYLDWELILVDDGSKDGSDEVCDRWREKDNRIKVIHKTNGGVSSARNAGLDIASGEYILFLDSDDALDIDACKKLHLELEKKACDCLIFGITQENGNIWAPCNCVDYDSLEEFQKDFGKWLNSELLSPPFNKVFKRNSISYLFRPEISFGEDLIFCLNYLSGCNTIRVINDRLYLHNNLNEASVTHNFKQNRIRDIECWQKEILSFASNKNDTGISNKYIRDVIKYVRDLYRSSLPYKTKKRILREWYPESYWCKMSRPTVKLNKSNRVLSWAITQNTWWFPEMMWRFKRFIKHK